MKRHTVTLNGVKYKWRYEHHLRASSGERCDGVCMQGDNSGEVIIDQSLYGRSLLDCEIHEALHAIYPTLSEKKVMDGARDLARLLTTLGYAHK